MGAREQSLRLVEQCAVQSEIKAIIDRGRAELLDQLGAGERVGTTDIGFVTVTRPKDEAVIVEPGQLDVFLGMEGATVAETTIVDHDAAVEVLAVHAPHLVEVVQRIPGWAHAAAQKRALAGEQIPGIAVRPGRSVVQVRAAQATKDRAREILSGGLPALEAGQ